MKISTLKTKRYLQHILVVGIWLLVWQVVYRVVGKDILFPSLFDTLKALGRLLVKDAFYKDIGVTLYRVGMGCAISFGIGIVTAILAYFSPFVRALLKPFVTSLKSTPVMGIIILALLWFTSNQMPIFVCFLMCYPVVYTNILAGFLSVDEGLI